MSVMLVLANDCSQWLVAGIANRTCDGVSMACYLFIVHCQQIQVERYRFPQLQIFLTNGDSSLRKG
jgi:hypothetical protein